MMTVSLYQSPIGKLFLIEEEGFITNIYFNDEAKFDDFSESEVTRKAKAQLELYFKGELKEFDLSLSPQGTDFQKKVWKALQTIPYGQTISYLELAILIGNKKATRAVGQANHYNPIPIIIPCHRVISANGKLGGYAGGIELKIKLLEHEKITKNRSLIEKG